MRRMWGIAWIALASVARGDDVIRVWTDAVGDAVIRRTDTGNNGPMAPGAVLPDLVRATLGGWDPYAAVIDPYAGEYIEGAHADFFRLDLTFAGLVNPPGTLGLAGQAFDPHRYGVSPVYGFLDIDVDGKNTGGELGAAATQRYLYNVGRFGGLPKGSIGERAARWHYDDDGNFSVGRQFERTGADFAVVMCGCWETTIVSQNGNMDAKFDSGETWVVRGRFFQRAGGYTAICGSFGGSSFGAYDPWCNMRFAHNELEDRTTLTLVFPLNMKGASRLTGQPIEPMDFNVSNHVSVAEALADLIDAAGGTLSGPHLVLAAGWSGRDECEFLDPTTYKVTALFGTTYTQPEGALYVWTDVGFAERQGDLNSDGQVTKADHALVIAEIAMWDGTIRDADGVVNSSITIVNPGPGWSVYDVNGDGKIDLIDAAACCRADMEGDGDLDIFDFLAFQLYYVLKDPKADFDEDGDFDIFDYLAYLDAFATGC